MVSVIGTSGTGFLQNDACWRELERLEPGALPSPHYLRLEVADRTGVLALVAQTLSDHGVSVARLVQDPAEAGAVLHVITHEAPEGAVDAALRELDALAETRGRPRALRVVSDRGVEGLGWA
jgi:homoserine dehydrogenase